MGTRVPRDKTAAPSCLEDARRKTGKGGPDCLVSGSWALFSGIKGIFFFTLRRSQDPTGALGRPCQPHMDGQQWER